MWKLHFPVLFLPLTFQIPLKWMDFLSCFIPFSSLCYFCLLAKCSCFVLKDFTTSFCWRHLGVWSHLGCELSCSSVCGFLVNLAALQSLIAKHMQNGISVGPTGNTILGQKFSVFECIQWGSHHLLSSSLVCTVSPAKSLDNGPLFLSSIS